MHFTWISLFNISNNLSLWQASSVQLCVTLQISVICWHFHWSFSCSLNVRTYACKLCILIVIMYLHWCFYLSRGSDYLTPCPLFFFLARINGIKSGGCVSMKTNQQDFTGVFMKNPRGLRGSRATIKGIKGQTTCGFKRPSTRVMQSDLLPSLSPMPRKHTHTNANTQVCRKVVN